ncbi:MAG: AMP-binding protein [Rhizobiales bacterium]|nr:AMP-binding protein [Hyphomicrobiales bacterium]
MSSYKATYVTWKNNGEEFWANEADKITWDKRWDKVFDPNDGPYGRWFSGAKCNTCFNALDRHVVDRPGQAAIIYHSQMTGEVKEISYEALLSEVEAFAKVIQNQGVEKGDRVIIYMPMIPEAAIAMLACARIGAVHSVVFGGFAAEELSVRINDCNPKLIIAASCGLEPNRVIAYKPLIDKAIEIADHKVSGTIIFQREGQEPSEMGPIDKDWKTLIDEVKLKGEKAECVSVEATDPLYVLYTSGTTGKPKGVLRDNGGHMVALKWTMQNFYGIEPGEVMWAASDVGWVVGHSYIVYGPLLQGATTLIFEGKPVGTPDAGVFWKVIEKHNVNVLFTAPTAIRAIKREDPNGELMEKADLTSFRALFLAGERADPDTINWSAESLKVPVIDHWWQTETGWAITGIPYGLEKLPTKVGSSNLPMPGYQIDILDEGGNVLPAGEIGAITVKLPLPPGCAPTLWGDTERYVESYLTTFDGYYETADAGYIDEDGYVYVMARTDDVINVAGHRLSTGGMEEVVASHKDVAECAVFGMNDKLKGQLPIGFIVLYSGVERSAEEVESEVVKLVREKIGPVAAFKTAVSVNRLPKTRSGKILRGTMRKIANGEEFKLPATIDDPAILDEIKEALGSRNIG